MTINLSVPELNELRPRITVFGVGGAGGNAVAMRPHPVVEDGHVVARVDHGVDDVRADEPAAPRYDYLHCSDSPVTACS